MAAFNSLSDLRQRYANDPTRLAAINAGAREGIAEARGRPNSGLSGLRERSRAAYAAASTPEASRTREAWVDAESRPGAVGLEAQARRRTANMFGANTRPVSVGGVRDLGSMTGAEAEERVRANPRLAEGGVFGRNDRAAAMQRNQDFIRSGRASMFGPRPATTKGILSMRNAELKGQELENTRRADAMRAANDRYNAETTRQGNSILAGLRGEELRMTDENNQRAADNERLKNQTRLVASFLKALSSGTPEGGGFSPEQLKLIEQTYNNVFGGAEAQGGEEAAPPAAEQEQPAAPSYKYQERPEGDLNNKDVQAYYAERGIGPKSWLKALRNPAQPNQQAASPAGTSRQPTLAELGADPASVASPEAAAEQAPGATKPYVMLPIPSRPQAPYTPNFLPPTQSNSSLNSLSSASIPAAVPKVDRETARRLADPMRKFNPFYKGF